MGKGRKWAAQSALPFVVWALETLEWRPEVVLHECTPAFEASMLEALFGEHYSVHSFVFSPVDLGIPSSRPRRHRREQSKPNPGTPSRLPLAYFLPSSAPEA
jgi:hypothetical protein